MRGERVKGRGGCEPKNLTWEGYGYFQDQRDAGMCFGHASLYCMHRYCCRPKIPSNSEQTSLTVKRKHNVGRPVF